MKRAPTDDRSFSDIDIHDGCIHVFLCWISVFWDDLECFIRHSAYLRHTFRIGSGSFRGLLEAFRIDSASIRHDSGTARDGWQTPKACRTFPNQRRSLPEGFPIIPKGSRTLPDHPEGFQNKRFGVQILKLLKLRCRISFDPDQFPNDAEGLRKRSGMTPKGSRTSRRLAESSRICDFHIREPFGNHSGS